MAKTRWQFALVLRQVVSILTVVTLVVPVTPASAASVPVVPALPVAQATDTPVETPFEEAAVATEDAFETPTLEPTSEPTLEVTPPPSSTTTTQPTGPSSPLWFDFSAKPAQAAPGETVTFTVTIENLGADPISKIAFINTLPPDFTYADDASSKFKFDEATRELTWASADTLELEQTIQMSYTVRVQEGAAESLVLDEATVSADGLKTSVNASAEVNIVAANVSDIQGSPIDVSGGVANGLNDNITIRVPSGAVDNQSVITIQNIDDQYPATNGEPWIVFEVSLQSESTKEVIATPVKPASTQVAESAPTETVTTEPTLEPSPTATIEPTAEPSATLTPEATETSDPAGSVISESLPGETVESLTASETATATPTETATLEATAQPTDALETATPTESVTSEPTSTATSEVPLVIANDTDERVFLEAIEAEFEMPVELSVSFDGVTDLATLDPAYIPILVTLDEASNTWVRVPIKYIDLDANTITADVTHFSTWGAGVGTSFPQNGANVLLFDSAQPDLFTGRSHYSIPIWTPPGRNGIAPALSLTYSSGTTDGVLGDVQAPWAGMGWSIGSVEIARKITNGNCGPCGGGSYGYKNEFLLLFNGTGYELIPDGATPGRYHTKEESFLYIQLHNDALSNNSPAAQNTTGEWWEVVERNGTRWRLGWDDTGAHSEQVTLMVGYPGNNTGAWVSLGYAGSEQDVVAARWRADRVTDLYGNYMTFSYEEETRTVSSITYDKSSYLEEIQYTKHTSGSPASAYSVLFERETRNGQEVPQPQNDWDNWDDERLKYIKVKYNGTTMRTYELTYTVRSYGPDDGKSWTTTVLDNIVVSGSGAGASLTYAPKVSFTYTDKDNRANCGSGCQEWSYPRLEQVYNGWGGNAKFTYQNDGRGSNSWYNYRVQRLEVSDGVSASPMWTEFAYTSACYRAESLGWCNGSNLGELVGYGQTTVTTKDFGGSATLAVAVHKFHTDEQKQGREYEVQYQKPDGTVLSKTTTSYTVANSNVQLPFGEQLISYWQLDEASGTRNDSIGANHLTSNNNVGQATGKLANAASFVRANSQYLSIADNASLSTGDIDFTVSAWVYLSSKSAPQTFVSKRDSGTAREYKLMYSAGDRFRFSVANSSGSQIGAVSADNFGSPSTGVWYFIVAWHDSTTNTVNIQINNGSTNSSAVSGTIVDSTGPFNIGTEPGADYLDGRMDGVGFWKRLLTADERTALYNSSAGCDYPFTACPPSEGYFIYPSTVETFALQDGALKRISHVENTYDTTTGNLTLVKEFDGTQTTPTLYRQTQYDYQTNASPSVWILDKVWRQQFKDASGTVLSESQYGYDGNLPNQGTLSLGELRLLRAVNGTQTIDTTYAYDSTYGVLTDSYTYLGYGSTSSQPSGDYRRVQLTYDSTKTYVTSSTLTVPSASPAIPSQTATTDYYFDLGVVKWSAGPNGNPATDTDKTRTNYDGLGRVTDITYPTYANNTKNVKYSYPTVSSGSTVSAPFSVKMELWDELAVTPTYRSAWAIYDGLGRTLQVQGPNQVGTGLIVSDTAYNAMGAVLYSGLPRASSTTGGTRDVPTWANIPHSTASYDALGRLITLLSPDGSTISTLYNGLQTTFTDKNLHQKVQEVDAFGRLVTVKEYTGTNPYTLYATTNYQYDERNSLEQVTDAQSNVTTITYDAWGRKDTMSDPDMGDWAYTYHPLGELNTQTDARNCVTTMTYDHLGRLQTKVYSGSLTACNDTPDVTYGYDDTANGNKGLGLQTSVANSDSTTVAFYNLLGQMEETTQTITINSTPTDYTTEYHYDAFGRLKDQTYPDTSELLTFYYNAMGLMSRVDTDVSGQADYVSNINYNENGQVTDEKFGNNIIQEFCYQSTTLRLTSIRAYAGASAVGCGTAPSSPKLNLSYLYDAGGNVTQLTDSTRTETTTFEYDALDRLTEVFTINGATPVYQKNWSYNQIGNMTAADTISSPAASTLTNQLISYWKLDEASGARNDSAGSNNLTSYNGVGQATGKLSYAGSFTRTSSQYLVVTDNGSLSTGDIDFTISAWVYLNEKSVWQTIVAKGASSTSRDYKLNYAGSTDRFRFNVYDSSGNTIGNVTADNFGSPSTGVWYFVVGWFDSTNNTVNIQVNDGSVNTSAVTGTPTDTTSDYTVGTDYSGDYLNGRLDGIGFWKRVLTASERTALYNSSAGCDYPFTNCPVTSTTTFQDGVSGYTGTTDTQIQQSAPTTNYGTATTLKADGDDPSGGQDVKSLLKWDISSIPSGSTINSVSIVLNVTNSTPNNYYMYEVKQNWTETQATWNIYSTGNNWQTAGASGVNDVGTTSLATVNPTAIGSYTINLNSTGVALVQSWVNGSSTNNGFIIADSTSTDGMQFDSSEATTAANRPKLVINYTPPSGTCTCASYTYGDTDHKHAVTALSTGESYDYDENGNMVERTEGGIIYDQVFDANNRLTHVYDITSGSPGTLLASFLYDGNGTLVKKFHPNGVTVYVGGLYEMGFNTSGTLIKKTSYYPAGGAMRVEDLVASTNNVYYLLKDHLGSASVTLDSSGTTVAEMRYYPFGETRVTSGTMPTDRLFTGQKLVSNIGLYNYGARFYDPKIGRFISADTIVPNWANPQSLNRYSYVLNNPLLYIDPTGHFSCSPSMGGAMAACKQANTQAVAAKISQTSSAPCNSFMCSVQSSACNSCGQASWNAASVAILEASIISEGALASRYDGTPFRDLPPVVQTVLNNHDFGGDAYDAEYGRTPGNGQSIIWYEDPINQAILAAGGTFGLARSAVSGGLATAGRAASAWCATNPACALLAWGIPTTAGGATIASQPGSQATPATIVRVIQRGESVQSIMNELKDLTGTYHAEYAVVRLADGTRAIVTGGSATGMTLPSNTQALIVHTHPYYLMATGPSDADLNALQQLGQVSSYLLQNGVLEKFYNWAGR